jgi:hypothetical protein
MLCWVRATAVACLFTAAAWPAPGRAAEVRLECLQPAETRDLLQTRQFIRPFRAMAEAARGGQGDPIGIRMCRLNGTIVYDVMLLRHDGRVVGALVDAARGAELPPSPPLLLPGAAGRLLPGSPVPPAPVGLPPPMAQEPR